MGRCEGKTLWSNEQHRKPLDLHIFAANQLLLSTGHLLLSRPSFVSCSGLLSFGDFVEMTIRLGPAFQ